MKLKAVVLLTLAAASLEAAPIYTFTQLDVPGATATVALGINDAGQIVGHFANSTGTHGFLDTGGSFTQLDVPGATVTQAIGINDAGQIVGTFANSTGGTTGLALTGLAMMRRRGYFRPKMKNSLRKAKSTRG